MRHALIAATALALTAGGAFAATQKFHADLGGNQETPAHKVSGTGTLEATLDTDTHKFDYSITFSGLTGPLAAAHFHGPAKPGKAAGVALAIEGSGSPLTGSATLTPAQEKQLESGLWYVNLHTANNPKGEIRGQVEKTK